MPKYSSYIAAFLFLLFVRVMVPDVLLLELHAHTHTVHTEQADTHEAQVGQKHKHCPVEDLFGAPYQLAGTPVLLQPIVHITTYSAHYSGSWHGTTLHNASLRGPPLA